MPGTRYSLEVRPHIPHRLHRLSELANNLFYGWNRQIRSLFARLDRELWEACGDNPKVFLRRVSQARLEEAAQDRNFLEEYNRALSLYDTYHNERPPASFGQYLDPDRDLVAYFCAEYGLHESFPIYSGGLGILAGDHCKAASDLGVPLVAVGLLYRQGYFTQTIDRHGNQVAHYIPNAFDDLPVEPALDDDDQPVRLELALPGRTLHVRVWQARAGHVRLYLLDTDVPENSEQDRAITYQLYGGNRETRIQQEIVLGIGGVRALRALGREPTVWHANEGHAAFQIVERCREAIQGGLDFDSALELVAANTVFTTHTPVPAGHDIFDPDLVRHYFGEFVGELDIPMERFLELGSTPEQNHGFNMTTLALGGSGYRNGVSRIHGDVAARMEGHVWPEVPNTENPIGYVTNGVHLPTFLANEWVTLFDGRLGAEWRTNLNDERYWKRLDDVPNHFFWSVRQSVKEWLRNDLYRRICAQARRNGTSDTKLERMTALIRPDGPDVLLIGFARRFATYKRATLLFRNPERLARLLNQPDHPVVIVFAGKAHPEDMPGQELIQTIHEFAQKPEFIGKILLVENYDLGLARKLVAGVDVWLNTPEYPMEASGTSGQKAGMNGAPNLSILDGWWGEGFEGDNGWAINPHGPEFDPDYRDREEATELLRVLEHRVIPLYYERKGNSYSDGWVRMSKASMRSLIPRFNAQRMVMDYVRQYYAPARRQGQRLAADGGAPAQSLAAWKQRVRAHWDEVALRRVDPPPAAVYNGDAVDLQVAVQLGGLTADDVLLECLVGQETEDGEFEVYEAYRFSTQGTLDTGETLFGCELVPALPGLQCYKIRMYPYHPLLSHVFDMGLMRWL